MNISRVKIEIYRVIALFALWLVLPASSIVFTSVPVYAADNITTSVQQGAMGSTVLIRVFNAAEAPTASGSAWVSFTPDDSMPKPRPPTVTISITTNGGTGSEEFTIGSTPAGKYWFKADFSSQKVPFTVVSSVTLSQTGGLVGDPVEVWGNGFAADKPVTIYLDDVKMATSETDDTGSFPNTKFIFPPAASGKHIIMAKDSEKNYVKANYSINPRIILTPASGCVGDTIQVSAAGFPAVANVILSYDGTDIATVPSDARGNVNTTFKIPPGSDLLHKIKLTDGLSPVISNINILPSMTISQENGWVGMGVTLNGNGFRSGNALNVTYDNTKLSGTTVGQNGSFTFTFNVPKSKAGPHNINITDGVNNKTATFTMEATPPPAPGLVAPAEGIRFTKDARFLWEGVTDPSGVTYTIEICEDTRFSQSIISQSNLGQVYLDVPDSAKTLPGRSDQYYWRVRAIDGASNVGPWSAVGSFYKGVTMESVIADMPAWAKYALIGTGLILFIFMVIFIRRNIMRVRYADDSEGEENQESEYYSEWEQSESGSRYNN